MNLDVKEISDLYHVWKKEFVENNPESWRGPLISFQEYLLFKFIKDLRNN